MSLSRTVTAAVALAVVAAPSSALAAKGVTLSAKVSPSKAGTKQKPRPATLRLTTQVPPVPGNTPTYSVGASSYTIPKGIVLDGRKLPTCSPSALKTKGAAGCKSTSKVGSGSATAAAIGLSLPLKLDVYNGAGGKSLVLNVLGSPLPVDPIVVKLKKAPGSSGQTLSLGAIAPPQQGVTALVSKLELTLKGKVGKGTYVTTIGCTGSAWAFGSSLAFSDGDSDAPTASAPCS